jgi:antagonist of KipI
VKVTLEIIKSGVMTSIQDLGRPGLNFYAIANSGAMDIHAAKIANLLLRKNETDPVIECTFIAPTILFSASTEIALSGADFGWKVNNKDVLMNQKLTINKGDVLQGGQSRNGMRAYIAVLGNLELEATFGSYSTQLNAGIGGFNGRLLKKGDVLKWTSVLKSKDGGFDIYEGPEFDWLSENAKEAIYMNQYTVSSDTNRMGIRLIGEKLNTGNRTMTCSVPLLPGFIQLPPSGLPIIVLQDGQTTGGYPRIAYIKREELYRLNQVKIGEGIRFSKKD